MVGFQGPRSDKIPAVTLCSLTKTLLIFQVFFSTAWNISCSCYSCDSTPTERSSVVLDQDMVVKVDNVYMVNMPVVPFQTPTWFRIRASAGFRWTHDWWLVWCLNCQYEACVRCPPEIYILDWSALKCHLKIGWPTAEKSSFFHCWTQPYARMCPKHRRLDWRWHWKQIIYFQNTAEYKDEQFRLDWRDSVCRFVWVRACIHEWLRACSHACMHANKRQMNTLNS